MAPALTPFAQQHERLAAKVFAALERLSHVVGACYGRVGGELGLTSLQVFLLLEVAGKDELGVRELAARFSVSRPTVSRSLVFLQNKGLVAKAPSPSDRRRAIFSLTREGRQAVTTLACALEPALVSLEALPPRELESLWASLLNLLLFWEREGLVAAARTCRTCRFLRLGGRGQSDFCELLQRPLTVSQLRLDCRDHQSRTPGDAAKARKRKLSFG